MKITKKQLERLIFKEIVNNVIKEQTGMDALTARWAEWYNRPWQTFVNNLEQGANYGNYGGIGGGYGGGPSSTGGNQIGAPILDALQISPQTFTNAVPKTINIVINEDAVENATQEQFATTLQNIYLRVLQIVRRMKQERLVAVLTPAIAALIRARRVAAPTNLRQQIQSIANNDAGITNIRITPEFNSERKITNVKVELIVNGTDFTTSILTAAEQANSPLDENQQNQWWEQIKNTVLEIFTGAGGIYVGATVAEEAPAEES